MVEPVALTLNVWLSPTHLLTASGWAVIATGLLTVKTAADEVRLGVQVPDNWARYL